MIIDMYLQPMNFRGWEAYVARIMGGYELMQKPYLQLLEALRGSRRVWQL